MLDPFYHDPQTTIYCGDNLEIQQSLPKQSVDMIMTSPPYFWTRKYDAPEKLFDNHNGCSHTWLSAGSRSANPDRSTGGKDLYGNGIYTDRIKRGSQPGHSARGEAIEFGSFCTSCNAWKGQLGLEPDPDLYIKHLCDIFDASKHVLKKTALLKMFCFIIVLSI